MNNQFAKKVSVIIPTLNEEAEIGRTLDSIRALSDLLEIIVVDSASTDRTVEIVSKTTRSIQSERGRGMQMNKGANECSREILWFIHADCQPHPDSLNAIQKALVDPDVVGGGFQYSYSGNNNRLKFIARCSNLKNRTRHQIFGDMGIFVRRTVFERMNGFQQNLLMEDFDFSLRLKKEGKVAILKPIMISSPRQWDGDGMIKKMLKDCLVKAAYQLGVSGDRLYKYYYRGYHEINK